MLRLLSGFLPKMVLIFWTPSYIFHTPLKWAFQVMIHVSIVVIVFWGFLVVRETDGFLKTVNLPIIDPITILHLSLQRAYTAI